MTHYILRRKQLGRTSAREIARGSRTGIVVYRNDGRKYNHETNKYERTSGGLPSNPGYVFRWGCTSSLLRSSEECTSEVPEEGAKIVNTVAAIRKVNDKAAFRKICADADIAPRTWLSEQSFIDTVDEPEPDSLVVRRSYHAQGRNLHVCSNREELRFACSRYGEGNYYISELIEKVSEYRVCFVSGRVAWVAQKTPGNPDQVAWNVAQGGRFDNVRWEDWPLRSVRISSEAFELSGLDFGGVDVMVDSEGKCYVLEINSAPSLTSPYRQECMTKCFDYIVQNGKDRIPMTTDRGNYKKFIHPALTSEAILV
jgi:hypothetical protein